METHLEPACQELVLDLQEVAAAHFPFEGLVQDGVLDVVLYVLPASVAVSGERGGQGSRHPQLIKQTSVLVMLHYWSLHGETTLTDQNVSASRGLIMVPRSRNARGVTDPLRPCGPSLRPPRGPDVRLPEIVTFR